MRKLLVGSLTALLLAAAPLAVSAANPCAADPSQEAGLLVALETPVPAGPTVPTALPFGGQEPVFVDCIDGCIWGGNQCAQGCGGEDWACFNACSEAQDRCIMYCSP